MHAAEDETEKGCYLILLSLALLAIFIYQLFDNFSYCGFKPQENPATKGVITKSLIQKPIVGRGCEIIINYEYEVNGKKYISQRVSCNSTGDEEGLINKYPVGKQVKVFYKSNNPKLSVLEPKIGRNIIFLYITGCCFLFTFTLGWVDNKTLRWLAPGLFGIFVLSFSLIMFLFPPTNKNAGANILFLNIVMHLVFLLSGLSLLTYSYLAKRS